MDLSSLEPILKTSKAKDKETKEQEAKQFEKQYEIEYTAFNGRKVQYKDNKSAAAATLHQENGEEVFLSTNDILTVHVD